MGKKRWMEISKKHIGDHDGRRGKTRKRRNEKISPSKNERKYEAEMDRLNKSDVKK
jgi:hypothetical protein